MRASVSDSEWEALAPESVQWLTQWGGVGTFHGELYKKDLRSQIYPPRFYTKPFFHIIAPFHSQIIEIMKKIDTRKVQILKLIVEEYIRTGDLTGSKSLLKKYDLQVSSATVRNDMAALEKMGLIFQPYNSAGRLPTTRGIRVFVDYLMEHMPTVFIEAEQEVEQRIKNELVDDTLYMIVSRLAKITHEITFACVPTLATSYYLGLSNFLEKNVPSLGSEAYNVIKVLENKYNFIDLLRDLDIGERVSAFIGEENIIPDLESCAIVVKKVNIEGHDGYIGILGSLKMDYAFNIAALKNVL